MNAAWMMVLASLLFATMSVCVKLASSDYGAGEIVFYRGLVGALAAMAQMLLTRVYTVGRPLANAVLQYLGILFAFAYGVLLFGEGISAAALAGVALIVAAGLLSTRVRAHAAAPADTSGRPAGEA